MSEPEITDKKNKYEIEQEKNQITLEDNNRIITTNEFLEQVKSESECNDIDVVTTGTYGKRLIKKYMKPHLVIDYKEKNKIKPYIDIIKSSSGYNELESKFLRLNVKNLGKIPATYCEAKFILKTNQSNQVFCGTLHWVKHDTTISQTIDDFIELVTINAKQSEELDLMQLRKNSEKIELLSDKKIYLNPDISYLVQITVQTGIGNNPIKLFNIRWDGTYDGFDSCMQ